MPEQAAASSLWATPMETTPGPTASTQQQSANPDGEQEQPPRSYSPKVFRFSNNVPLDCVDEVLTASDSDDVVPDDEFGSDGTQDEGSATPASEQEEWAP